MSSALLSVDRLTAGYAGVPVVRDLSLEVHAGEVVALLGANGAGKTTTLITISGLQRPIAGEIRIAGTSVVRAAPSSIARMGVAHVPESRGVLGTLTVRENLTIAVPGRAKAAAVAIDRVLATFPALRPLMTRQAALLSGGEQQMLVLARAFLARPRLLMIDEMSLGLSPIIVDALLPAVRQAASVDGVGVLLVEQHIAKAMSIADRGYVLRHGDLVTSGSAAYLRDNLDQLMTTYLGERRHP